MAAPLFLAEMWQTKNSRNLAHGRKIVHHYQFLEKARSRRYG